MAVKSPLKLDKEWTKRYSADVCLRNAPWPGSVAEALGARPRVVKKMGEKIQHRANGALHLQLPHSS